MANLYTMLCLKFYHYRPSSTEDMTDTFFFNLQRIAFVVTLSWLILLSATLTMYSIASIHTKKLIYMHQLNQIKIVFL